MIPLVVAISFAISAPAQIDVELAAHVAGRRKVMDDVSRPIADREAVALELAGALDRAAWAAPSGPTRRALWSEARGLLRGFTARNREHPRARSFAFQGAVFDWAEGQSWARQADADPGDDHAKARATASYDDAITTLRPLNADAAPTDVALAQNIRYRLALALAHRARLDPPSPAAVAARTEALAILEARPLTLPSLKGFGHLLRADLLAGSGRYDDALAALEASSAADPPPPLADRLAAMVPIAAGRKRFGEALAALEAAGLDDAAKDLDRVRLRLAERASLEPGADRSAVEAEILRRVEALRTNRPAEARLALLDLARKVEEFGPAVGPEAWSRLAEGAALLGQADRAASLDVIAAAKYETKGMPDEARSARFRAAAVLFDAGRFARCDALLTRLVDDPDAGPLRPRAGLLRALARGRRLASGEAGDRRAAYVAALADQVQRFPDDPTTGEARWLLGRARLEDGDRAGAEGLWASVPRSHSRWLDARLAEAALRRADLEDRRLVDEAAALRPRMTAAREALDALGREARTDAEKADVRLEGIRLELVPGVGDPGAARASAEHLRRLPLREDQRDATDRLKVVAIAASEGFLEAEHAARELGWSRKPEPLLALARDLDRLAASSSSERFARRVGEVARLVADRLDGHQGLPGPLDAEARLRRSRSKMLAGDLAGARQILDTWPDAAEALASDPLLLAELADAFLEVGMAGRAIVAYRGATHRYTAGSPRWLADRLGQARALDASGNADAARRLLDGTTLLYPELGGPAMKDRYGSLRRKLDRP